MTPEQEKELQCKIDKAKELQCRRETIRDLIDTLKKGELRFANYNCAVDSKDLNFSPKLLEAIEMGLVDELSRLQIQYEKL